MSTQSPARWPESARLCYALLLPQATPSNNTLKELHFHAYKHLRRKWRSLVVESLGSAKAPRPPIEKAFLVVERHCAGGGLDWDNAYGGLKPLLDCLVAPSAKNPDGLGLIRDDNPENMPVPPFVTQHKASPGKSFMKVEIFDLEN